MRALRAVAFGAGDTTRALKIGRRRRRCAAVELQIAPAGTRWRVTISPRLIELAFAPGRSALAELYARGAPIQYAHHRRDLPLWSVQTAYASRPWRMPSAGRPPSFSTLLALRRHGVESRSLSHAAGLSATGDPALDAALLLPERPRHSGSDHQAIGNRLRGADDRGRHDWCGFRALQL
jgi:S-adenosylmethionine:tRNA ribosyltransferase-isomerase